MLGKTGWKWIFDLFYREIWILAVNVEYSCFTVKTKLQNGTSPTNTSVHNVWAVQCRGEALSCGKHRNRHMWRRDSFYDNFKRWNGCIFLWYFLWQKIIYKNHQILMKRKICMQDSGSWFNLIWNILMYARWR